MTPAALTRSLPDSLLLSGHWTAPGVGDIEREIDRLRGSTTTIDGRGIEALDTAGAWILQRFLGRLRHGDAGPDGVAVRGLSPAFTRLLDLVGQRMARQRYRLSLHPPRHRRSPAWDDRPPPYSAKLQRCSRSSAR